MFAGYDFAPASPEQSLKDGTPKTPKSAAAPTTPRSTAPKPKTPGSARTALAETTDSNTTSATRRMLQITKSPLHGLSPKVIRNIANAGSRNLVAEIRANAEAEEAKRLARQAEKKEERKRQWDAVMEDHSHVELQDISAIDMDALDQVDEDTPEESIASQRAARVSTTKSPPSKSKSKSQKPVKIPDVPKVKTIPTAADIFFRQQRKAKAGSRVGDANIILEVISRSMSPQKPDISKLEVPGWESDEDEGDVSGISDNLRLDLLEDNEDISGLLSMAKEVRGTKRVIAPVECEVFWSKEQVNHPNSAKSPSPSQVVDLCGDVPTGLRSIIIPALQIKPEKSLFVQGESSNSSFDHSLTIQHLPRQMPSEDLLCSLNSRIGCLSLATNCLGSTQDSFDQSAQSGSHWGLGHKCFLTICQSFRGKYLSTEKRRRV